jgi:hypothetical protein
LPETVWAKSCGHGWLVQHGVAALFGFGGRDNAAGACCEKVATDFRSKHILNYCYRSSYLCFEGSVKTQLDLERVRRHSVRAAQPILAEADWQAAQREGSPPS